MNPLSHSESAAGRTLRNRQRHVHLDFHTSPYIPDVSSEFDAVAFARTLKRAHVNSINIFAKCHHGMSYYPTKVGTQHPALGGRDLMGEMIEALHREDIRCPLYTTIAWEEDVAQRFPEWRQLRSDGAFAQQGRAPGEKFTQPGGWRFNNFLHPDYQDYIEAHVRELLDGYEVDGFWFDILIMEERSCWSEASVKFRERHGLLADDRATQARFETAAQEAFARRFTALVQGARPEATIFYNTTNPTYSDATVGVRGRVALQTHFELESLPSGFWGYHHFPRLARQAMRWDTPLVSMTGRFQRMWGDFGGIKPAPALEYECFRAQALGMANSVGDQLPPRGTLDPAAYELIGAVYEQTAAAEPFYEGSTPLPQVAIAVASYPGLDLHETNKSEEGAVQLCEEVHYDAALVDDASDLDGYELVLLPDSTVVTEALAQRLQRYWENGGKLIVSHRAGFDARGDWALPFLPLSFDGPVAKYPTYWRARETFAPTMAQSDRVFYQQGMNVRADGDAEVLVERVLPYFPRTDLTFSSHFQTPPVAESDTYPAVVGGERWVYFADPIFREYRQAGNGAVKTAWLQAMDRLIGPPPFGAGLPSTVLMVPRRRGKDLILTLLHYIPVRKALDIDVIEERMSFANERLRLPAPAEDVRLFGGEGLPRLKDRSWALPADKGRLLIEVFDFFADREESA